MKEIREIIVMGQILLALFGIILLLYGNDLRTHGGSSDAPPYFIVGPLCIISAIMLTAVSQYEVKPSTQPKETQSTILQTRQTVENRFFCMYCGAQIPIDSLYCERCGKKLKESNE